MKEKFIRFKSTDNIELCGIIYTPEKESKKTIVHVHGLAGNFYENKFISFLAKAYTNIGYNFLTFNNRGNSYIVDLLKEDKETTYINGGGAYEKYEESFFDIEGIINYLKESGNEEIILQGHSYGCNKIISYYHKKPSPNISKIILLAPCDIVHEMKVFMDDKYEYCVNQAKKLIEENKENELIDSPIFPITFSANTFITDWMDNSKADTFRYRLDNYIHEELKDINIPILIEIGTKDECVLVVEKDKIENYFQNNLEKSNYKINYIIDANHGYQNHEKELTQNIIDWIQML